LVELSVYAYVSHDLLMCVLDSSSYDAIYTLYDTLGLEADVFGMSLV